ncbi:MAG: hypothetical protein COB04_03755 [Gammaproteobacteria bacterium]|nr:MAG: hypothetical protein COB04_03755 [Gammaproteobacteria bacterium]
MIKRITIFVAGLVFVYVASVGVSLVQLRTALFEKDTEQLTQSIDFDSVRLSLKDQIDEMVKRELGQGPGGSFLATFGAAIAAPIVEQMLTTYVTPDGIFELIRTGKPEQAKDLGRMFKPAPKTEKDVLAPKSFLRSIKGVEWVSVDQFKLMFASNENKTTAELRFKVDGFRWRLVEITLPALAKA